jgi:Tfp pilus assembly protein PilE
MDNLQSELAELKQFIVELKADRAATKEKERREAWTKYVSLTVVIVAVIASVASQWSGKYSSMTQMSQAQASDQWNFYQAQSIKQYIFEANRALLPKDSNDADSVKTQKEFDAKIASYAEKKADIKAKAEKLEQTRDYASKTGGRMGVVMSSFTISIAVASICLVTKKKPLWFLSMLLAAIGIVQMILIKVI